MIGRPVNPNSARQQRIRAAQGRQKLHGRPKLATDNGKLVIPPGLIDAIQANAKERRKTRADNPDLNPFMVRPDQLHPPGSRPPKEVQMAMDQALGWASGEWGSGGPLGQVFAEGLAFPGYPYLSELAQRPEYRTAGEIISTEMTRKWIQFSGKGTAHQQRQRDRDMAEDFGLPDPHAEQREDDEAPDSSEKQEKIAQLEEFLDNLNCRGAYRLLEATDCYFGRSHLFHEINGNDGSSSEGSEKLQSDIGLGVGDISQSWVSRKTPLTRLTNVEPVWIYPTTYNAMNPLVKDFYNPSVWYMQGIPVHCSRMFTQIGRPVPDLLKPAYSFGGLSLSQIMQPYVNIWLETRESIGRLIHAFSVMVLSTDLQTLMQPGGGALMERINLFNTLRDNNGCFVINKNTEDFKNISVPLGGLHELQAQSQEHMASIIRVPVAIYTGISPTGLNASSEGEIRIFENNIHAAQESRYRQNLTKTINFAQLSLWDEIDPDITFEFVQLRELTEKEEAELRKLDAETDDILMNGCQAISPEEVRIRVAGDDNGPHAGIDPDDLPEPPQPPPGEAGLGGEGQPGEADATGEPKPGGRINVSGREEYTGVGENEGSAHDAAQFNEGDHPRAPDGKFGSGSGSGTNYSSARAQLFAPEPRATTKTKTAPSKVKPAPANPSSSSASVKAGRVNVSSGKPGHPNETISPAITGKAKEMVAGVNAALMRGVPELKEFDAYPDKYNPAHIYVAASTERNDFGNPDTVPGHETATGMSIKIDATAKTVHFGEITSKVRGAGSRIVDSVIKALPGYKFSATDWSREEGKEGPSFWEKTKAKHAGKFTGDSLLGEGADNPFVRDAEFKESDHPRAPDGKFGSGAGKEVHVTARTNENGKPVILGAHPTAHAAEAHRDQVHKSDWDKQQREDFDDPEDREEFPGHEGFMKGQNNAHGELVYPENIVRWHAGSGGVGEGGETHVVATGEHSEAAGGPTMNIKVHGSYATKREADAAASVVAAQAWAQHGDTLGHHEDEWAEATTHTINDWNSAHPNDEPIDPEMVAIAGNRTGPDAWYVNVVGPDDELSEKKLPPELAKQIDALEEQPAPYPGLKKALAYWRDAGDYEHVAPVIKQLKMAP